MKQLPVKTALALCALFLVTASAPAAESGRQAMVDLKKVFEKYWKTEQADVKLKERATDLDKKRKDMVEDYQKSTEEYKKLLDSANDQAVSVEERDKRKKSAETKLLELREIEQSVQTFDRQARTVMDEEKRRMRDNILGEIRAVINTKAKAAGFTLVFDTAAQTINDTPVILYTNGQDDITEEVLTQLNATTPTGFKAEEKKDDGKKSPPPAKK
jgi:Skp family chaperone for outer membrane proteins